MNPPLRFSAPAPRNGFQQFLRLVVLAASTLGIGYVVAAVAIVITLWQLIDTNIGRFAAEGRLNPFFAEFLRHAGHAGAIVVSGAFLTLRLSRWRRNLAFLFLSLGLVPLGIFSVHWARGVDSAGYPLEMREMDPATSPWFDGPTGRALLWHGKDDTGKSTFYNRPGFHPDTNHALEAVTADFRRLWVRERERAAAEAQAAAETAERLAREKAEADAREAERRVAASVTATAEREADALRKAAAAEAEVTRRRAAEEAEAIRRRAEKEAESTPKARNESDAPVSRPAMMTEERVNLGDETVMAKPVPLASMRAMARPAPASLPSRTIPLRWNAELRCRLHGLATHVRTNGPAWVKVDDGSWQGIPSQGFIIHAGGGTLCVRPHRTDATAVMLTTVSGTP
jgi:hypothetical protein